MGGGGGGTGGRRCGEDVEGDGVGNGKERSREWTGVESVVTREMRGHT